MKIAHILQTSLDPGQGGIATYLRNIVPEQLEMGHDVRVVTNRKYKQFGKFSLPMRDFNFLKDKKSEALLHSLNVNSQLTFSDFDVLHYHFATSAFFSAFPALAGKKRVLTVHGRTEVARELNPITKSVLDLVNKTVIPNMDAVTTVTPYLKEFIEKKYGVENLYLPHGFKPMENIPVDKIQKEFGLTKDSYYLALGRLTRSKGFGTIIEAYKMLPETSKKLVIAGPPEKEYEKKLKASIPKSLEDKIIFTGAVRGENLSELYSNSFAYISGIENMGLSLTVLEGVGYKIPVITSKVEGDNYAINNHTHRFENNNPGDLSSLMRNLENNPKERLKFIDSAYKCANENHSWKHISDTFLLIYNDVLKNKT